MHRTVRIRVLRRNLFSDLVGEVARPELASALQACEVFREGQEFLIKGWPSKPDGFCDWAWNDIQKSVIAASFGARKDGLRAQDSWIACCTDGLRPVVFQIEPIEASS